MGFVGARRRCRDAVASCSNDQFTGSESDAGAASTNACSFHAAGRPSEMTGFGSRRSLLLAANSSTAFCAFSQNSGVVQLLARTQAPQVELFRGTTSLGATKLVDGERVIVASFDPGGAFELAADSLDFEDLWLVLDWSSEG